jgi:hypothetical protein
VVGQDPTKSRGLVWLGLSAGIGIAQSVLSRPRDHLFTCLVAGAVASNEKYFPAYMIDTAARLCNSLRGRVRLVVCHGTGLILGSSHLAWGPNR